MTQNTFHVVAVTSKMKGVAWEIKSASEAKSRMAIAYIYIYIYIYIYTLHTSFDLGEGEKHHMLLDCY